MRSRRTALPHRWADGTTHLRFDPLGLLERLAVLTPRPRVNLILYYGVLAPRAAWRAALVPAAACGVDASPAERLSRGRRGREPQRAVPVRCISMGRADAPDVWVRRPGVF